jgi:tetratricopeptide (TPR) repeat protein/transcriptional regulator with XRE-family HTH domain
MTIDQSDFFPFGTLLKAFRTRIRLTQQQLAEQSGVRRNTIGTWERGDCLPGSKGIVLELARHLHLNDQEARRLLEASLTALSPYWLVPFPRNTCFIGRDALLHRLHTQLAPAKPAALSRAVALSGLGGIGKTQLAVEYAYRSALEYSAVFWLAAETAEGLMTSMQQIAEQLQLPERQAPEQPQVVAAVQRWLIRHVDWLMIADNVEDLDLLQAVLPSSQHGSLLLTTRRPTLGTLAEMLEVPPMSGEEGITLVLQRAHLLTKPVAATELVTHLEGLPLALDQAGAYIDETQCVIAEYLRRFQQQRSEVLARRGIHGGAHPASVATTLRLSVQHIAQEHPTAIDLLCLCAFLHSEAIPEELLLTELSHLRPAAGSRARDSYQFDLALVALRNASLVTRHPETRTLSVHRLVQAVLQDQMEPDEAQRWSTRVVRVLHAAFPAGDFPTWSQCERLLPHVLMCAATLPEQACERELVELFQKAGDYLTWRGQYAQAETLFRRALRMQEQSLGPDHPQTATSLYHLAFLAYEQGKYEQAETLFHQTLVMYEQALGAGRPEVARSLTGLANLYTNLGHYQQAEPLYERALHIWEQIPGLEQPEMGWALNGLAILRKNQGHYEQAEVLYERALRLRERALGSKHPLVAMVLNNLATLYRENKKYEQATVLYQRARQIWEQGEHPDLAYALSNLGEVSREQEQYEQAETFSRQALSMWERTLGPEHFLLAYPLNNLGQIAQAQGRVDHAESLFKRCLQIRENQLAADHPATATTLSCLATLYRDQGKYEQAEPLFLRALGIREQQPGSEHPGIIETLGNLAALYRDQCRYEQAEALYQRVLALSERRLEPVHPQTGQIQKKYQHFLAQRSQASETAPREQQERAPIHQAGIHTVPASEEAPSQQETDPLQTFLVTCCERHPHAWCRASELWQAYQHWVKEQREPFSLSRRALTAELKARGYRADRTNTARLWRGIALAHKP